VTKDLNHLYEIAVRPCVYAPVRRPRLQVRDSVFVAEASARPSAGWRMSGCLRRDLQRGTATSHSGELSHADVRLSGARAGSDQVIAKSPPRRGFWFRDD
jgi:hypothetical protein